jgi:hypothetical protein
MRTVLAVLLAALAALTGCGNGGGGGGDGGGSGGGPQPTPLSITTTALAAGAQGQAYSEPVVAAGGSGVGYTWSIISGVLPAGITLAPAGTPGTTLAGTPSAGGISNFTVQVQDSLGATATAALQINVTGIPLSITTTPGLADATAGSAYSEPVSATGGTGTYSWATVAGALPPGLALAPTGTPSTTISGTPSVFGRFDFTVEVTDSATNTASLAMTLIVVVAGAPDSWPSSFALVPDRCAACVFTGSRTIQFGGEFSPSNEGEVMEPGSGTYTSTTTTGAPAARIEHTGIWTGSAMIVHGGRDLGAWFGDTFSYDPIADSWTSLSTTGAPSPRANHSAIWTGTEMIIWGGYDSAFNELDDGAAYDPAADTWRALAAVPTGVAARERHKAVWTGSMMIVWGGYDVNDIELHDGAAYDPAGDSWSTVTDNGAPEVAAHESTVVWTGTDLFVWGPHMGAFMDGATWNFTTTTWSWVGTSTIRRDHTSVVTPTGIYVWGGLDLFGTFAQNDGEFFNFTTQNWTPIAATTLIGRFEAKGFWTGRQVILWGGKDFGFAGANPQSDGQVYQP